MRSKRSARTKRSPRARNATINVRNATIKMTRPTPTRIVRVRRSVKSDRSDRLGRPTMSAQVAPIAPDAPRARSENSKRLWSAFGAWTLAVVLMSGALIAIGRPSANDTSFSAATPVSDELLPDAPRSNPDAQDVATPPVRSSTTAPTTAATPVASASSGVKAAARESEPKALAQADVTPESTAPTPPALEIVRNVSGSAQAAPYAAVETGLATVSGCLDDDDKALRLKDVAGADAPKTRSWKSGFFRKRAASIAVVDPAGRLGLATHVGERVSLTGRLDDRQMQVRSIERLASSCE